MKKLLFASMILIAMTSCVSTFDEVTPNTNIPYSVTKEISNTANVDSVLLIRTNNYHYILEDNIIVYRYDVTKEWMEGVGVIFLLILAFFLGMGLGSIISI